MPRAWARVQRRKSYLLQPQAVPAKRNGTDRTRCIAPPGDHG